jgi:hypothetical protein
MEMLRQCDLRTPTGGSFITWVPAEHAVPGRHITLKLEDGSKSPALLVATVFALTLPLDFIRKRSRDWTKSTDYVRGRPRDR